jgi:hypothetical protein
MLISATKAISNIGFSVLKYFTPALIALFGLVDMQGCLECTLLYLSVRRADVNPSAWRQAQRHAGVAHQQGPTPFYGSCTRGRVGAPPGSDTGFCCSMLRHGSATESRNLTSEWRDLRPHRQCRPKTLFEDGNGARLQGVGAHLDDHQGCLRFEGQRGDGSPRRPSVK